MTDAADDAGAPKVGYRNPPRHTQFKPGQSGNPGGRPRGPGHSGEVATDGNYTVYQWGLPGGRVNVDFADNGLSVRNTTLNPHIFAGQIDRHIYSDRFGTFITTRGTGTAEFLGGARDWLNEQLGPGIFEGLNEDAAAYAKKKFKGC